MVGTTAEKPAVSLCGSGHAFKRSVRLRPVRWFLIISLGVVAAACSGSSTAPSTANLQLVGGTTPPAGLSGLAATIGTGPDDLALWLGTNVHCDPPGSGACTWTFDLQNIGTGCAANVHGVATVYLSALALQPNSTANFTVASTVKPSEIVAAQASFASIVNNGTVWVVVPSWDNVSCS